MLDEDGNQWATMENLELGHWTYFRMATTNVGDKVIRPEAEFKIGGYEVMVDHALQQDQYVRMPHLSKFIWKNYRFKASTSILNRPKVISTIKSSGYRPASFTKAFRPPIQKEKLTSTKPSTIEAVEDEHRQSPTSSLPKRSIPTPAAAQRAVAASSFYTKQSSKPYSERIVLGEKSNKERLEWGGALFNPHAEGAVVMPRPAEKLAKLK